MSWKPMHRLSLRARLLTILIPVLTAFSVASLYYSREDVIRSTNAAYDRSLLGVIKSVNLNVSNSSGGLSVELPYSQFEFFQLTASGNVYFRVSTLDGLVEVGNHDLPRPPVPLVPGKPVFYDAHYFGESVRVGAYLHAEPPEKRTPGLVSEWLVQVAEQVESRETFARALIQRAMLRDGIILLLVWVGVGLGLAFALKPLLRFVGQLSGRKPTDLTPLPLEEVSPELQPLIAAVNHQLQRTETLMAERRSFIDDASHQLRTPLSVLQMQIDYALREQNPGFRYEVLQSLSHELGHAIRGTNQLLSLAESDATTAAQTPFDLAGLVREVVLQLMPLARQKNIDLGLEGTDGALPATGDPYLISQALSNIVHNAIQHGNAGGVVTVSMPADDTAHAIRVTDNGPGIPGDVMERMGERFKKGKKSRGSGLGIAIARSVMAAHRGGLAIAPAGDNMGTQVELTWPKN